MFSLALLGLGILWFSCPNSDHGETAQNVVPEVSCLKYCEYCYVVSCGFCFSGVTWEVVDVEDLKQEVYDCKPPELSTSVSTELPGR